MKKEKKRSPPAGPGAKGAPFLPVPKGWAVLRPGALLKAEDQFFSTSGTWLETEGAGMEAIAFIYIRKVKKARAK